MTGWPAASSASAERVAAAVGPARERDPDERPVRAVGLDRAERLEVDRDDPDAVLAGALGDELLDPRAEARDLVVGEERQLVAAGLGQRPDGEPERDARVDCRIRARGRRRASPSADASSASRSIPMSDAGTSPT